MRNKFLCGLAALAIGAGAVMALPAEGQAQLFNSNKKKDTPAASGTTADKSKPPSGSVFNHSGSTPKPSGTPSYLGQKPQGMQSRTVPSSSNAGFTRKPGTDASAQDKAIREAAMRRMAKGDAVQAASLADADRRSAMTQSQISAAINAGGSGQAATEVDTRTQVYDKHKGARDPGAPAKLFNSSR